MSYLVDQFGDPISFTAQGGAAVVTSDIADLTRVTRGVYIGISGDLKATLNDGTTITFVGLSSGMIHPIAAKRIFATGTTATNILAVY